MLEFVFHFENFQVLKVVTINIIPAFDVTLCSPVEGYQCFVQNMLHHLQDRIASV